MTEQLALQIKLRNQLFDYQKKNPAFSLRSFAKKLQVSPSSLSEILNGKRNVSKKLAVRMLARLGSDPKDQNKIIQLFDYNKNSTTKVSEPSKKYLELSSDHFQILSQWHHFAILSLTETKGFIADPVWISERLGIKVTEAELALERLQRLELVEWNRLKKSLKITKGQLMTSDDIADTAVRKSHFEDLQIAAKKLDEVDIVDRDFTSMTVALDKNKLPQAKKMIRNFQDQLATFLETGTQTEVYKICFHLFTLSQNSKNNRRESL
jgi:uncharacterized protein (TIGR02147 family)